ncbi:MAG: long-chain fatty acid--CoA ligase [Nannocystaceae bacterium]
MANNSILDLVLDHATIRGDDTAALIKSDGAYQSVTWKSIWQRTLDIAGPLVALGLEQGDRAAIISHTRLEWVTTDLGILAAGGVTVPIYPSSLAGDCQYIIEHSDAKIVFCEDAEQVRKLRTERSRITGVIRVVQMTGEVEAEAEAEAEAEVGDSWVMNWNDFLAAGPTAESVLEQRRAKLGEDSILTIIYTSGTTGRPKGVVLTHANMLYEGEACNHIDIIQRDDTQLMFLPLAHVFAKVLEVSWFSVGHVMAFAESMSTIKGNLAEVHPTFMAGVPRVFEKFYAAVVDKGTATEGLKKRLFLAALDLSQRNGEAEQRGGSLGLVDAIKFELLKKLIFAKVGAAVQELLGGRMARMLSGGAPLSQKVSWFFRDAGLTLVEGYGLTETSAGTCINRPSLNVLCTVGPPLPKTELKIAQDGEVLVRGPGVMREYWKDKESTAICLIEGWLHTGDIGEVDRTTGALRITDRKKDLIVTAGGKNIAPQKLENLFTSYALVSHFLVIGDRHKFLSALLTLDPDQVRGLALRFDLQGDYAELTQRPEIEKAVAAIIAQGNKGLPSFEQIKKFKVLTQELSVESGELTPKLSVKRKVVLTRNQEAIDEFYAEHP